MANMKCMCCHYKMPIVGGLPLSVATTCPKCKGMLVCPETPGGRRMRLKVISQTIRDISIVVLVIVLGMLNARYSAAEFDGTVAHRIFSPLSPPVLMCLALAWLQRYFARLWSMVLGQSLLYSDNRDPSGLKRFAWIGGTIFVAALVFLGCKADVWPFSVLGNFIAAFIASDVAVGAALMLFLVQRHFTSEDYMTYIGYIRERPEDWCTGLPASLEITQCYAVCALLTLTGLMIACGPVWFAATKFGEFLGTCHGFFESLYGLFGGLIKMAAGLIIGIFNFIF